MNKVILIGRVGKDPESKEMDFGVITKFSLATSEKVGKGDSRREVTEWHNIVCFGKVGEIARDYIKKGALISVEGRIKYNEYENKEGVKNRITEIICDKTMILSSRNDQHGGHNTAIDPDLSEDAVPLSPEDDLPF